MRVEFVGREHDGWIPRGNAEQGAGSSTPVGIDRCCYRLASTTVVSAMLWGLPRVEVSMGHVATCETA